MSIPQDKWDQRPPKRTLPPKTKPPTKPPVPDYREERRRREAEFARRRAEAQARQRAEAQRRRQQAKREAYLKEQKRRIAISERAREAAARRRVRHTVERDESAEQIAKKYGTDAQDIASQVTGGLKAGQILDFNVPGSIRREKAYSSADYGAPGGRSRVPGRTDRAQRLLSFAEQFVSNRQDTYKEEGGLGAVLTARGEFAGDGVPGGLEEEELSYGDSRHFRRRGVTPGQTARISELATERGQRAYGARMTWTTLDYVWKTGDWELRPEIIDPWTFSQQSLEMQQRVIEELGYYIDEEGYVRRIEFLDEGYGMGEGYGGYGFGGGGGGGYEEKTYTKGASTGRGGTSNVRTRGDTRRLASGYKDRTSWRI